MSPIGDIHPMSNGEVEVRHLPDGVRAVTPESAPRLVGRAIVANTLSAELGSSATGVFRERILPAAITRALATAPDVVALRNHDVMHVLGRRSAHTLRLATDAEGLTFEVDVPESERSLLESVARGDLPGASFSFSHAIDEWDTAATPPIRTVTAFRLIEVSCGVPFPAYDATHVHVALRSLEAARQEAAMPTPPAPVVPVVADPVPPIAPSLDHDYQNELRKFSLRALLAGAAGLPGVDWSREREVSQEVAHRSGRTFAGFAVPFSVFEQRVVTTGLPAGGPGANIIATDYKGESYIDRLRAALVVRQLGATVLSGLVGNVAVPRLKASATGAWVAENAALTVSDPQWEQVTLSPKHVGALTEYSRNMLLQSSPDIEALLRDDFAKLLARAVDQAAINGGGANEPVGILRTAGIGDVALGVAGGAPTWASVIALTAAVEQANATGGGFLTNFKATAKLKTTVKVTTTDSVMIMDGRDTLAGYPLVATSLVPSNLVKGASGAVCSALIFGNFADVLLGYWSELDVLVNPYESTAYAKGNVQIRGFISMDVKLRHPESFAAIQDILTT
jgi:HK97 family phage major capsid protein/HK97 family phage prohead protease